MSVLRGCERLRSSGQARSCFQSRPMTLAECITEGDVRPFWGAPIPACAAVILWHILQGSLAQPVFSPASVYQPLTASSIRISSGQDG